MLLSRNLAIATSSASANTCVITSYSIHYTKLYDVARWALKKIYRPGYAYQKAGVVLMNLCDAGTVQGDLFSNRQDNPRLMQAMDRINATWGRGTLRSAAEGIDKEWTMKREKKSPAYTTRWDQLPEAR